MAQTWRGSFTTLILLVAVVALGAVLPANALATVRIDKIVYDPPGSDSFPEPNSDINKELVKICNNSSAGSRSLRRWRLRDRGPDHTYRFGRFRLRAGQCVKVHTGKGKRDRHNLYWGLDSYVWNNDGDRATLVKRGGDIADRCGYKGGDSPNPPKDCT